MSVRKIRRGELRELDPSRPSRVNYVLRPDTRAYVASAAAENHMSETDVIHAALDLLKQLGEMGIHTSFEISPPDSDIPTIVTLGLDVSTAAFSARDYQALYESRHPKDTP